MYFSNISNEELQHCHKITGVNINMSLTDILNSDLFKTEQITNNIYRIYPLFYCNDILSTDPKDIILDNKCIILKKGEKETYISFTSSENYNNHVIDDSLFNLKGIGDKLSLEEFNGFVYLLRNKTKLQKNASLNDEELVGDYGTYIIDNVSDQLKNGMGFIINDKIKNEPITIKLTNPFFINAKYILTFTVQSITGANIIDDESFDYITKTSFDVELIEDIEVPLNLSNFTNDSVLLYDFEVELDFSVNEIVNSSFEIDLSSNFNRIILGNHLILTANLGGDDNVRGYLVHFYEDNNLIGVEVTDNDGNAVLDYVPSLGNHIYSCEVLGLTDTINIVVNRYETNLTLESNKSVAYIPTTFTVSGVLNNELGSVAGATIKLYNNDVLVETDEPILTNENGEFEHEFNANTISNHNIRAVFETTGINNGCNSNTVSVTARKINTNCTISTNRTTVYYDQTVTVSGVLTDEFNNKMSNRLVSLYNGSTYITSTTTNSNGAYSFSRSWDEGTYSFRVRYSGDTSHNTKTSSTKTVYMTKIPTTITIINPQSEYNEGDTISIKVSSTHGDFTPESVVVTFGHVGQTISTLDSGGNFVYTLLKGSASNGELIINYGGNEYYANTYISRTISVSGIIDTITLTLQGNRKFIINCKKNGVNVTNKKIAGLTFYIGSPSKTFDLSNTSTDSNGNITFNLTGYDNYGGNAFAYYGTRVSNTVYYIKTII